MHKHSQARYWMRGREIEIGREGSVLDLSAPLRRGRVPSAICRLFVCVFGEGGGGGRVCVCVSVSAWVRVCIRYIYIERESEREKEREKKRERERERDIYILNNWIRRWADCCIIFTNCPHHTRFLLTPCCHMTSQVLAKYSFTCHLYLCYVQLGPICVCLLCVYMYVYKHSWMIQEKKMHAHKHTFMHRHACIDTNQHMCILYTYQNVPFFPFVFQS